MKSVCTLSTNYNLDNIRNLITHDAHTANKVSSTPFVPVIASVEVFAGGIVRNSTTVSVSATASNNSRDSSEPALAIEELVAHLLADLVESSWQSRRTRGSVVTRSPSARCTP